MKNIVQTGEWDGEPIWREETPEETIRRYGLEEEVALLGQAILNEIPRRR